MNFYIYILFDPYYNGNHKMDGNGSIHFMELYGDSDMNDKEYKQWLDNTMADILNRAKKISKENGHNTDDGSLGRIANDIKSRCIKIHKNEK